MKACWILSGMGGFGSVRFDAESGPDDSAGNGGICVDTGQPLLDGKGADILSLGQAAHHQEDCLEYYENESFLIGLAQLPADSETIEKQSYRIYRAILEATGERSLYRIWNFVPEINHEAAGAMENYKLFCSGRVRAFAEHYGDEDTAHFPSASATGSSNGLLTVVFLAGHPAATHWENPDQVPAYQYPQKYGPRPPAFARASRFTCPDGGEWVMVAGTAAIKGSETLYPGDFSRQLPVTFDNLSLMLGQVGMQLDGQGITRRRHVKVFLRRRENLAALKDELDRILGPNDTFSVVEGDICRSDLEVEIELTVYPDGNRQS